MTGTLKESSKTETSKTEILTTNIDIIFKKIFFDEIKMKVKANTAVKNPITYAPNSKNQIPKNDTTIKPISVYSCSRITIGTVLLLGIPNFVFNS